MTGAGDWYEPEAHLRVPGEEAGHQAAERAQRLGGDGHRALGQPGGVAELVLALVELAERAPDPGPGTSRRTG